MNSLRSLVLLLSLFASLASAASAATGPLRLFELGASRFSRDASGQGRVETGRLDTLGRFTVVVSGATDLTHVPEAALNKPLIFTEAWHAYGQLGPEARNNFRLKDNGAPVMVGGLLHYVLEPHPEARFDVGAVVNLSTRGLVAPGATPKLIGGFVIEGQARRVLIRAVGPSLLPLGVDDAVGDPFVSLLHNNATLRFNGNWGASADVAEIEQAAAQVGAFPLNRASKDAAILVELQPGAYTVTVVSENPSFGGTALLEIYVMP
jgi:hypothetical protein